jgi:site-specific recombinase XerD
MKTTPSQKSSSPTLQNVGENLYRSETSNVYYALFKRNGKQIRRSLKTTDKELARRRLADLRQKVGRLSSESAKQLPFAEYRIDEKTGAPTRDLIGGLAHRWLEFAGVKLKPSSYDRRLRTINSLAPHFSGKSVASIGKLDVEEWAAKRSAICKARTFNMESETLRLAFDYAMSHGLVLDNPAAHLERLKLSRPKLHIPTREEFKALLATIRQCRLMTKGCDESQASGNLVEFLGYSGCRLAEAVGDTKFGKPPILWGDVNFKLHTFTVTGKGIDQGKTRTVPLFPPVERLLREMKSKLPAAPNASDPIFNIQSAKKAIETACRRLGLPHYSHHTFRHFFASNAIEHGIDFKVIAEWLGHADGGVLVARTYGHLRAEHSAAMAKRMTFDAAGDQPDNVVQMSEAANR